MATLPKFDGLVRFGLFEVDITAGELRKSGIKVKIQEQPFRILLLLLERPGEVVSREQIIHHLWPDGIFVDYEHSVNTAVRKLRDALGDDPDNPRFVETVPRRGYRLIAPLHEPTTSQSDKQPQRKQIRLRWILAGTVLLFAFAFGARFLRHSAPSRIESVAVLPFVNLSSDPEQEYFTDGVTDELIATLGRIKALRVISRTSMMQYKGARARGGIREIAQQLKVDEVVEGSVLRSGDRVRITAQLIHASDDRHLWAESYERELRDVLALQEEVARTIADQIKVTLTPQEQAHLASARMVNPEAHELYLRGRFLWNKRTEEGLKKSIEYFQRVVERDPSYAVAYSGLADSYNMLGLWGALPQMESAPKAKAAAIKALEIDEQLAEAHASLAWTKFAFDWDWPGAEREFKRAIELNPSYATSHRWFANCLTQQGRHEEALAEIKRAQQLDPLSLITNSVLAYTLYMAHRYDEAIEQEWKTLELDDKFAPAHWVLGMALEQKGKFGDAITELRKATTLDTHPIYLAALGHAYGLAGQRREGLASVRELAKLSEQRDVAWNEVAVVYVGIGEKDKALATLDTAYKRHDSQLNWLKVDPRLDIVRLDPRFQDLLHRMNLPPP